MYWTTLGEGGGRITLPSLVAPAIGHLFLIIEGRVRRVGHFIKKTTTTTTCKQNYNEKYRQCSCVEVLFPYLSPTFISNLMLRWVPFRCVYSLNENVSEAIVSVVWRYVQCLLQKMIAWVAFDVALHFSWKFKPFKMPANFCLMLFTYCTEKEFGG